MGFLAAKLLTFCHEVIKLLASHFFFFFYNLLLDFYY
jgi:hypothetical protein